MAKTYQIFISHSWDHIPDLKALRRLLENRGYFKVEFNESTPDDPINSNNQSYLRQRIKDNISKSDVVIGLAGLYASYSEWMEWELKTANSLGKPIIGVVPWGCERVSKVVQEYASSIVRWNTESIVDAIRNNA